MIKDLKIQSIFVQCPTWVGDFIMATPSIRSLRNKFPQAEITLCMAPLMKYLVEGAEYYDHLIFYDKKKKHKGLFGLLSFSKELRKNKYDLAVIFPNSIRTGIIGFLTRAQKRIGYERLAKNIFLTNTLKRPKENGKKMPVYTGGYYAKLLELIDATPESLYPELPILPETEKKAQDSWNKATHSSAFKIVMTPGAKFGSSKLWPARHWAKLIDLLVEKYQANIMMVPGPDDKAITQEISQLAKSKFHIHPPSAEGLALLKAFIDKADLVVCNDTGPRHIAHAFRTPSVVLMGPNDPRHTYTPLENTIVTRNEGLECMPCNLKVCLYAHHACMQELHAEKVFSNVETILKKEGKL
ncbi:lipopolysaccharide heptosyltransferase II [Candidatus Uabimicrobium sp. HlEnr_7]|uniref:lipopolysaccharide heptosyltransferase II n=1 Tax=Candidatus Uabimicrobium helgolandensis TaxID=3095367 RepID=UPI0035571F82